MEVYDDDYHKVARNSSRRTFDLEDKDSTHFVHLLILGYSHPTILEHLQCWNTFVAISRVLFFEGPITFFCFLAVRDHP